MITDYGPRWWWHANAIRLKWWDESSEVLFYANTIEIILAGGALIVVGYVFAYATWNKWNKGRFMG